MCYQIGRKGKGRKTGAIVRTTQKYRATKRRETKIKWAREYRSSIQSKAGVQKDQGEDLNSGLESLD